MALTELRSDLSWYGTTSPGPYKTPPTRKDTKFKGTDDVPYVSTSGYEFQGIALISPVQRFAGDSFLIDDVTFSDRGLAGRKAQFGTGTKFPIGPSGQIHSFDQVRTGFTVSAKYGEVYSNQSKKGLADTYTLNSPIDDMYNKFNLRDDATPNSYIKHPLILRGIQRQGKTDNQRWGLDVGPGMSGAFDIPRGGIITAVNRTLIDVVRHAKFLASPRGIGFLAKQVGYQLMNPKAETRIYNPLSLGSLAPIVHINRQFGTDEDGIMYGLVKKLAEGKSAHGIKGGKDGSTLHEDLRNELFTQQQDITKGSEISTLSSKIGGPGSLLGLLGTSITRHEDTRLAAQWGADLSIEVKDYETRQFKYDNPYQQTNGETGGLYSIKEIDDGDNIKGQTNTRKLHGSLKETLEDRASGWGFRNDLAPNGWIGGGRFKASSNVGEIDYTGYETNNYEALAAAAKGSTRAGNSDTTTVNDFLTKEDYVTEKGETRPEKALLPKQDDTGALKDFDGGGRGVADDTLKEVDYTGYKTNTYTELTDAATDRTPKTTTDHDFLTKENYNTKIGETRPEKKLGAKPDATGTSKDFDGGGTSTSTIGDTINDYTRMAYGDIPTRTAKLTGDITTTGLIDFRETVDSKSKGGLLRWADDKKIDVIDDTLDTGLINFSIGGIKFKAYIGDISDNFAGGWNGQPDQGRADSRYLYESFERTMTTDFIVPITRMEDRGAIWGKWILCHISFRYNW
jgi:hypothetical protein